MATLRERAAEAWAAAIEEQSERDAARLKEQAHRLVRSLTGCPYSIPVEAITVAEKDGVVIGTVEGLEFSLERGSLSVRLECAECGKEFWESVYDLSSLGDVIGHVGRKCGDCLYNKPREPEESSIADQLASLIRLVAGGAR